jgi:hypothetical protein
MRFPARQSGLASPYPRSLTICSTAASTLALPEAFQALRKCQGHPALGVSGDDDAAGGADLVRVGVFRHRTAVTPDVWLVGPGGCASLPRQGWTTVRLRPARFAS